MSYRPLGMVGEQVRGRLGSQGRNVFPATLAQNLGTWEPLGSRAGREPGAKCLPLISTHSALLLHFLPTRLCIYLHLEIKGIGKSNQHILIAQVSPKGHSDFLQEADSTNPLRCFTDARPRARPAGASVHPIDPRRTRGGGGRRGSSQSA